MKYYLTITEKSDRSIVYGEAVKASNNMEARNTFDVYNRIFDQSCYYVRIFPMYAVTVGNRLMVNDTMLTEGAFSVVRAVTRKMIDTRSEGISQNNMIDRIYKQARNIHTTDHDVLDIVSVARVSLLASAKMRRSVVECYSEAYKAVNNYLYSIGGHWKTANREIVCDDITLESIANSMTDIFADTDADEKLLSVVDDIITDVLTDTQRIIFLYASNGLTLRQIANIRNVNVSNVYKALLQARLKVATVLFDSHADILPVSIIERKNSIIEGLTAKSKKRNK